MKIGIDISQIVHEGTGVAAYVRKIVAALVQKYPEHDYVLFGASLRKRNVFYEYSKKFKSVRLVTVPIPPTILEILWNRLRFAPIEWFTGPLDVFWSSDWTQPPLVKARGVTTIHDLSFLKYPQESHATTELDARLGQIRANIVATQKRRLKLAARECQKFFCDSEATKKDAHEFLGIPSNKLHIVYPGHNT